MGKIKGVRDTRHGLETNERLAIDVRRIDDGNREAMALLNRDPFASTLRMESGPSVSVTPQAVKHVFQELSAQR